jgi:DNA mismatch repair protein MutS2
MLRVSPQNLRDLGWARVTQALAQLAVTPAGVAAATTLGLERDLDAVITTLSRVRDLGRALDRGADLPLGGVPELPAGLLASVGGVTLHADDIFAVARLAQASVEVRQYLRHHAPALPSLSELASAIPQLALLASELLATFDDFGKVRDDASPELLEARQRLASLHRAIKDRLDRFIAHADLREALQDGYYTQRDDRYVIPVIASFQGRVPGIIHGTSNSGETVFIEPHAFVEINNAIKVAESTERHELERVLRERTRWIAEESEALEAALSTLTALDLLQARARLGRQLGGTIPEFSEDGGIRLVNARNPYLLLKGASVIPNTIELPADRSFLIVTGPNTGGKTVTLKTVGLCYLMLAAGLPIPVEDGSRVTPVRSLSALIGDAQDLERDLSTFSGHLLALQALLDAAEPDALVLLDEIATGTEPTQGAALAIAVLESLAARGARGFVTTHYERLKTLPFEDARFANAAVGLDPVTLAPTFVLEQGRPGASNPFEVALHLGFSGRLIERARAIAARETGGLTEALGAVAGAEQEATAARERHARAEAELAEERQKLAAERARLERLAREEVEALYADARAELKALLETLDGRRREVLALLQAQRQAEKVAADKDRSEAARVSLQAVEATHAGLRGLVDAARQALPPAPAGASTRPKEAASPSDGGDLQAHELGAGMRVWLRTLARPVEVLVVRKDRVTVAAGAVTMHVRPDQLGRITGQPLRPPAEPQSPKGRVTLPAGRAPELGLDDVRTPPPQTPDVTVDLRGKRREDVQQDVEPFLDRALRENVEAIWIIHGHGTGAMREEVREFLARSPYVLGYRPGKRHEGGDGVTIAFLKND